MLYPLYMLLLRLSQIPVLTVFFTGIQTGSETRIANKDSLYSAYNELVLQDFCFLNSI